MNSIVCGTVVQNLALEVAEKRRKPAHTGNERHGQAFIKDFYRKLQDLMSPNGKLIPMLMFILAFPTGMNCGVTLKNWWLLPKKRLKPFPW